jgi:hypothetical protein
VGEVLSASFVPSSLSLPKKQATVAFAKRSDALIFVEKFNGVLLDNAALEVKLLTPDDSANKHTATASFQQPQQKQQVVSVDLGENKRSGLFGTALSGNVAASFSDDDDKDNDDDEDDGDGGDANAGRAIRFGGNGDKGNKPHRSDDRNNNNSNNNNRSRKFGFLNVFCGRTIGFASATHNPCQKYLASTLP